MAAGDLQDGIHLTGHAGVMHRHNGLGERGNEILDLRFVQVERVGSDIRKYRAHAAQDKGINRGDKGEGGENNFVTGLAFDQQGRHLQGMRAGGGDEGFGDTQLGFEQLTALAGEGAITGDVPAGDRLGDVGHLQAGRGGFVEGDVNVGHRDLILSPDRLENGNGTLC